MDNRLIIALFILFAFIVFFSSLQTITHTLQTTNTANKPADQHTTNSPVPTAIPTLFPTPTQIPIQIQHPGFRVNVGGEAGDD